MQWRYGDWIEALPAGAPRAWWRAWAEVCSPVPTMQTVINWNRAGLLVTMPIDKLCDVPGLLPGEYTYVHSVVAMLSAVNSLQAQWRVTSGAARAANARAAYAQQRAAIHRIDCSGGMLPPRF